MNLFSTTSRKIIFRLVKPIQKMAFMNILIIQYNRVNHLFDIDKSSAKKSGSPNFLDEANQSWSWRLKNANHKLLTSGESYKNVTDCLRLIELVKNTNSST